MRCSVSLLFIAIFSVCVFFLHFTSMFCRSLEPHSKRSDENGSAESRKTRFGQSKNGWKWLKTSEKFLRKIFCHVATQVTNDYYFISAPNRSFTSKVHVWLQTARHEWIANTEWNEMQKKRRKINKKWEKNSQSIVLKIGRMNAWSAGFLSCERRRACAHTHSVNNTHFIHWKFNVLNFILIKSHNFEIDKKKWWKLLFCLTFAGSFMGDIALPNINYETEWQSQKLNKTYQQELEQLKREVYHEGLQVEEEGLTTSFDERPNCLIQRNRALQTARTMQPSMRASTQMFIMQNKHQIIHQLIIMRRWLWN